MATSRAKQEKEDPARPPSKEDVIVSLKFDDQSDLICLDYCASVSALQII